MSFNEEAQTVRGNGSSPSPDSQIMDALKRVEAGLPVPELCRDMGISTVTFYKWRSKYGGMDSHSVLRWLRDLRTARNVATEARMDWERLTERQNICQM